MMLGKTQSETLVSGRHASRRRDSIIWDQSLLAPIVGYGIRQVASARAWRRYDTHLSDRASHIN